jgi:hypothetical protein
MTFHVAMLPSKRKKPRAAMARQNLERKALLLLFQQPPLNEESIGLGIARGERNFCFFFPFAFQKSWRARAQLFIGNTTISIQSKQPL